MRTMVAIAFCLCLAPLLAAGCSKSEPPPPAGTMQVAAGIPPITWLAEKVGGAHVAVTTLVTPGQSPHSYEPTPSQIVALSKARLFLTTGWPFEQQLLTKLRDINKTMTVVDLREGIQLRHMEEEAAEEHEHEHEHHGDHHHEAGEPDPHIWLSPRNAAIMADTIATAFAAADPAHAEEYRKNGAALKAELEQLDKELAATLAPLKGQRFFVYHPAFGYFADAYGLIQTPVEIEGKEPGLNQLSRFIDAAKEAGVKVIFVQPQFSTRSAQVVADSVGGAVVPMDVLAYDYASNLREMARQVDAGLKSAGGKGP